MAQKKKKITGSDNWWHFNDNASLSKITNKNNQNESIAISMFWKECSISRHWGWHLTTDLGNMKWKLSSPRPSSLSFFLSAVCNQLSPLLLAAAFPWVCQVSSDLQRWWQCSQLWLLGSDCPVLYTPGGADQAYLSEWTNGAALWQSVRFEVFT